MGRFRSYKSKGRYYVVTTDSNGLAGGPYWTQDEADARRDELAALEAKQAEAAKQPAGKLNITPGYRSPDVEDGRAVKPAMTDAAARLMPPAWVKWNTPDRQPLPAGWVPPWKEHHLPVEPDPAVTAMIKAPLPAPTPQPPLVDARVAARALPPWAKAKALKP